MRLKCRCGKRINVTEDEIGKRKQCIACGSNFTVPSFSNFTKAKSKTKPDVSPPPPPGPPPVENASNSEGGWPPVLPPKTETVVGNSTRVTIPVAGIVLLGGLLLCLGVLLVRGNFFGNSVGNLNTKRELIVGDAEKRTSTDTSGDQNFQVTVDHKMMDHLMEDDRVLYGIHRCVDLISLHQRIRATF